MPETGFSGLQVTLELNEDDVDKIEQRLVKAPKNAMGRLLDIAQEIVERMQAHIPNPPGKNIIWESDKQRIAYFASDGFTLPLDGRPKGYRNTHIPYVRTGDYITGWAVSQYSDLGYMVYNDVPYSVFVAGAGSGIGQSVMHQSRWRMLADQVRFALSKATDRIQAAIQEAIDKYD